VRHRARRLITPLRRRFERLEGVALWIFSHGASVWPPIAIAIVLWLTWTTLRGVHIREVRASLRTLDSYWIWAACAFTALNVAVMGLYDVIAFRQTRSPLLDRWRYGAIAFAWSNFLTLGPLAGPAIRFWLYAPAIDRAADLQGGVLATAIAFMSGLAGWTAAVMVAGRIQAGLPIAALLALAATLVIVLAVRRVAMLVLDDVARSPVATQAVAIALVGWLDWLLAATVFVCVVRAGHGPAAPLASLPTFFVGQIIGLVSLAPGGFGSADAYWIARFPGTLAAGAGIVAAFRLVYYVVPWAVASLVLLSWATRRAERRIEIARRVIASLIGGGGVLVMLSSASPALHARLLTVERVVPLPLVEFGQVVAATTGLLLLALAFKLARGYRAAFRATIVLLGIGAISTLLKGFDWEETVILGGLAVAAASHASLFDRDSSGDWIEGPDVALAAAAVTAFFIFGVLSHRSGADGFARWTELGYQLEGSRFARSVITLTLAVLASAIYVLLRAPATFRRPSPDDVNCALELHAAIGGNSTPLMLANGDKSIFRDGDRGLCAYRIIGPYLVVFADPVVRPDDRGEFLNALFRFAGEADRRPLFYQLSPEWIPPLHDRGYIFFKLGEEGQLPLSRVTTEGPAGRTFRQILRRGERDGVRFRVMPPYEVARRMDELEEISDDWLSSKSVVERQFSIGFFDREYLARFPCAVVETRDGSRILAFANILRGPMREEFSVDLMRYRSDGPKVMDFLFASLFFHAKEHDYRRFNLGMAPLASVGEAHGAHPRERLARLVFQHGEHWYNFRGLRFFKQKYQPDWQPRYLSYQSAWEFPIAIAYVSALIAGGWMQVVSAGSGARRARPTHAAAVPATDP
jgi:phosphatidylglycerol lysyltransferase